MAGLLAPVSHQSEGLSLVIQFYKRKDRFMGALAAMLFEVQCAEDELPALQSGLRHRRR